VENRSRIKIPPLGVGQTEPYGSRMILHRVPVLWLVSAVALGCESKPPKPLTAQTEPVAAVPVGSAVAAQSAAVVAAMSSAKVAKEQQAKIGYAAPDFTLHDLDGNPVTLASFKGKPVVLEWFNPECPFVKLSHTKGSLVDTAARHLKQGVVWLAINSGAPGKQGHDLQKNQQAQQSFNLGHPILRDEDGNVGRAYGAERTPHLFVIDAAGVLVYRGAIDNSPDGEKGAPSSGKLVNYVDEALASLAAQRPITTAETAAYGCRVKYAD
jgi:peroxiredoxin